LTAGVVIVDEDTGVGNDGSSGVRYGASNGAADDLGMSEDSVGEKDEGGIAKA
jgi:hypothetical protein